MANDTIQIFDVATGEVIIREMTDVEQAQRNAEIEQWKIDKAQREQEIADARALKVSAYQKLGLSEAEIEALLPTPKPKDIGGN